MHGWCEFFCLFFCLFIFLFVCLVFFFFFFLVFFFAHMLPSYEHWSIFGSWNVQCKPVQNRWQSLILETSVIWCYARKTPWYHMPPAKTQISLLSRAVWSRPSQVLNHNVRKCTFGHVRPVKILIRLRIRAVWSESSLDAFRIANCARKPIKMPRLIWMYSLGAHVRRYTFSRYGSCILSNPLTNAQWQPWQDCAKVQAYLGIPASSSSREKSVTQTTRLNFALKSTNQYWTVHEKTYFKDKDVLFVNHVGHWYQHAHAHLSCPVIAIQRSV